MPYVKAAAAVILALFVISASAAAQAKGLSWMGDFRAFYCAAHVRLAGGDPYIGTQILACESQPVPAPLFTPNAGVALPAPVPGYIAAAFMPLAALPFVPAAAIWAAVLIAAFIGTLLLLRDLGLGDSWTLLVAFSIPVMAVSLPIGELPPLALFGVALAAWAAVRNRAWLLALGVALAMFEPHIGLAVAIAAAALSRRFAIAAGITLAALLVVSLVTLGIAGNIAYVREVLPAHELSELPAVVQYSLSWVLDRFGASNAAALFWGHASWIVMLAAAFITARTAFARKHPEFAIFAAPAFAVVGGPFLHLDHIALALPAALWLCARKERGYAWIVAGAICIAVPLLYIFVMMPILGGSVAAVIVAVPIVTGWLASAYSGKAIDGMRAGAIAILFALFAGYALEKTGAGVHVLEHARGISSALAQSSWSSYVRAHFVMTTWAVWPMKLPTWFGILAVAIGSFVTATRRSARTA